VGFFPFVLSAIGQEFFLFPFLIFFNGSGPWHSPLTIFTKPRPALSSPAFSFFNGPAVESTRKVPPGSLSRLPCLSPPRPLLRSRIAFQGCGRPPLQPHAVGLFRRAFFFLPPFFFFLFFLRQEARPAFFSFCKSKLFFLTEPKVFFFLALFPIALLDIFLLGVRIR